MDISEPDALHRPDTHSMSKSHMRGFIDYCEDSTGLSFSGYASFDLFAAEQFRTFWALFLQWSNINCAGDRKPVCTGDDCETAEFFPQLRLNYAENLLQDDVGGLIGCYTDESQKAVNRGQLRDRVTRLASSLQSLGVQPGDRVTAIARNNIEVVIAALATAAIGAVFSSCAHDMGAFTTLSRFQRLEPKILFANCDSKPWDVGEPLPDRIDEVVAGLPSLTAVITLDGAEPTLKPPIYSLERLIAEGSSIDFVWQRFPFRHPLFIMF